MNNKKNKSIKRKRLVIHSLLFLLLAIVFASCQNGNYYDAIPRGSIALVKVNPGEDIEQFASIGLFLGTKELANAGIDAEAPVYLFESSDGNLGVCAKLSSSSNLESFIGNMSKEGKATEVKERKDSKFSLINKSFLLAFNDEAMIVVGPVLASSETELVGRLSRYLELDPDRGVSGDDMFQKLQESKDNITMIAKAVAMPKQFIAPFLLGTPTGTSAGDITITASVEVKDSVLTLNGSTSSANLNIQQALDRSHNIFKKLKMADFAGADAMTMIIYANTKGEDLIKLMQTNKDLNQMLATGDFRKNLASINGSMAISVKTSTDKSDDTKYSAEVMALDATNAKEENYTLRVVLNIKTVEPEVLQMLSPFLSCTKKIVYQQ